DREPYNSELLVINIPPGTYNLNNINIVLTRTGATAVSETGGLPRAFTLAQNYPNPFNPATVIQYSLPGDTRVSLRVFDILGREVATLVDEEQKAGKNSVVFDALHLSSGIYYYRLNAGRFSDVKKMLLLR
ncbi:MAG: T9SS type A sorting domain-containing protein, partial [Bacteroidota bacterium]